jgi:pilus assembly protein TadC
VRPHRHVSLRSGGLLAVLCGVTVALLVGGWAGLALGAVVGPLLGVGASRWLGRQPSRRDLADERRVAADLPFAADLLAAALRAGAAPDVAARCVAAAIGGPTGERLGRVERALRLGAGADEAWSYLGPGRVVQAAVRSQHSGAAFAGALQRLADDLRADGLIAADAAARRAGVLIVLPLGLCFLPAFVLAGLVPVVVAVLGDVLSP